MKIYIKYILTIIFAPITLVISCKDIQHKDNGFTKQEIFSDSVDFLDIKNFEKLSYLDTLNENFIVRSYKEFYPDGTLKMAIYGDNYGIRQFISTDTLSKTSIYKTYYNNGKLKEKSLHNDLGFSMGNTYIFDENGKVDSLNIDKEYPFTFEMLKQKLITEKNIDLNKSKITDAYFWRTYSIKVSRQNQMNEDEHFTIPSWEVTFDNPEDRMSEILLIYDAKTGKLLKQSIYKKEPEICGNEY